METRQRILDAARARFVEHGYEETTMRAIAAEIEYTPTAIYHHFRNKEALLTELCTVDFRALASAFMQIGRIDDPMERLRKVGDAYVGFARERPMQYQLLFMTRHPVRVDAGHGDPSVDAYAFLRETCEAAIASRRLRPAFDDADELAQIAWSALHGLIALHVIKGEHEGIAWRDIGQTASTMHDILFDGMLAPPLPP